MTSTGPGSDVTRAELREATDQLFRDAAEIALRYFSGHGYIDGIGGYLCASDFATEHDGLSLADIMGCANQSPAQNKVISLDSCHSGAWRQRDIRESRRDQRASRFSQHQPRTTSVRPVGSTDKAGVVPRRLTSSPFCGL